MRNKCAFFHLTNRCSPTEERYEVQGRSSEAHECGAARRGRGVGSTVLYTTATQPRQP